MKKLLSILIVFTILITPTKCFATISGGTEGSETGGSGGANIYGDETMFGNLSSYGFSWGGYNL